MPFYFSTSPFLLTSSDFLLSSSNFCFFCREFPHFSYFYPYFTPLLESFLLLALPKPSVVQMSINRSFDNPFLPFSFLARDPVKVRTRTYERTRLNDFRQCVPKIRARFRVPKSTLKNGFGSLKTILETVATYYLLLYYYIQ